MIEKFKEKIKNFFSDKEKRNKFIACASGVGITLVLVILIGFVPSLFQKDENSVPRYKKIEGNTRYEEAITQPVANTESTTEEGANSEVNKILGDFDPEHFMVNLNVVADLATGNDLLDEDSGNVHIRNMGSSNYTSANITQGNVEDLAGENSPSGFVYAVKPQNDGFKNVDGSLFYFRGGQLLTGHQLINGTRYFFNSYGAKASRTGVDVSKYQRDINWAKAKAAGVDYAIIRVGFRGYGSEGKLRIDNKFEQNYIGATAAGVDVGLYVFSQATSVDEAIEEASLAVNCLKGRPIQYPIYIDMEYSASDNRTGRADRISKQMRTACAVAFCQTVQKAGYRAGVYASKSFFDDELYYSNISQYEIWVAHYTDKETSFKHHYRMWQYSPKGRVDGIDTEVDVNISLYDYAKKSLMNQNGQNVIFLNSQDELGMAKQAQQAILTYENNPTKQNLEKAREFINSISNRNLAENLNSRLNSIEPRDDS